MPQNWTTRVADLKLAIGNAEDEPVRLSFKRAVQILGITATATYGAAPAKFFDSSKMDPWTVTLRGPGRRTMTVPYYMGQGHDGREPEAAGVLNSLVQDASDTQADFETWCGEFGYDTDSIRALQIYQDCQRTRKRLERFLGPDVLALLTYDVECL